MQYLSQFSLLVFDIQHSRILYNAAYFWYVPIILPRIWQNFIAISVDVQSVKYNINTLETAILKDIEGNKLLLVLMRNIIG
jgi:hypothetical protein